MDDHISLPIALHLAVSDQGELVSVLCVCVYGFDKHACVRAYLMMLPILASPCRGGGGGSL
jgi:hypothetical protein